MAKYYGTYVGTPKQAVPQKQVDMGYERSKDVILVRDTYAFAAASIADTISLGFFGWEAIVDPDLCKLWFDALGASTTLSVGDVTYPAALAAATSTSSAGSLNPLKTLTIANYFQPLWKQLGYASLAAARLIGDKCELLATLAGGAATGNVTWQFRGSPRI